MTFAIPSPRADGAIFFAVLPDEKAKSAAHRLARATRFAIDADATVIAPERQHVTMLGLGRFDRQMIGKAVDAAARIRASAFRIMFTRLMMFGPRAGRRPVVLATDEESAADLGHLRSVLMGALARAGLKLRPPAFAPHLTLLYSDADASEAAVDPIISMVGSFALIQSLQGEGAHVRLGEWPLRA